MATKNNALRDKIANDWAALWASGDLEIGTAGMAASLCTFPLDATPFDTASGGNGQVALADVPIQDTADATGTAAEAVLSSSANTYQITGLTVGVSAEQVVLDNVSINSGQTVTLNSFTYTISASVS